MLESNRRAFDMGFDLVDGPEVEPAPIDDAWRSRPTDQKWARRGEEPHRVQVLEHFCKGCGICVDVCPKDALAMSETLNSSGYYVAELTQPDACTSCRICALMCPDVALRVFA